MAGGLGRAEIEGLVELVHARPPARAAVAAIEALATVDAPIAFDAILDALRSDHSSVRRAAIQALHGRDVPSVSGELLRLVRTDASWTVRRDAVNMLGNAEVQDRWQVLSAADDPHWRVRNALLRLLLSWGSTAAKRDEIAARLSARPASPRVQGLQQYLLWRWSDGRHEPTAYPDVDDPARWCPFWNWDPAVLARRMQRMPEDERRAHVDIMPKLMGHEDERIRHVAAEVLRSYGSARHFADVLLLLDEPRNGLATSVYRLMDSLEVERVEELVDLVLVLPLTSSSRLAWAVDQIGRLVPIEERTVRLAELLTHRAEHPPKFRCALARLAARWNHPCADQIVRESLDDPAPDVQLAALRALSEKKPRAIPDSLCGRFLSAGGPELRAEAISIALGGGCALEELQPLIHDGALAVRLRLAQGLSSRREPDAGRLLEVLQRDPHPHVRAAALTMDAGEALIQSPEHETSWHVLQTAARMAKVPLWNLEPGPPWQPPPASDRNDEPLHATPAEPAHPRLLGPAELAISPLTISGHYGLPVAGFARAVSAGVNSFFWEPNYDTMTAFMTRLRAADRYRLHVIAGTFEADGRRVRQDAERVLRRLRIERLAVFLLFWVRSWQRVAPDVLDALRKLRDSGRIAMCGLSTHSRPLALEAIAEGWNPVMVRHSAAHRGAEDEVFPAAAARRTSVLAFNCTCYGRLLRAVGDSEPARAGDCYRYTLARPGVTSCLCAPATMEQLEENLAVLHNPELSPEREQVLLARGQRVYEDDRVFGRLVRSV